MLFLTEYKRSVENEKKSRLALYVSKTFKKKRKHPAFQKYTPLRLYTPLSVKKRIITPSNRLTRTPNRPKSPFSSKRINFSPFKSSGTPKKIKSPFSIKKDQSRHLLKLQRKLKLSLQIG